MLREARIVMPTSTAYDSAPAHKKLVSVLVSTFGHLIVHSAEIITSVGPLTERWDDATVYDVAIEADRDASWDKLFQIAMTAGRELKQESVYIRYPDGHVEIASCAIKPTETRNDAADAFAYGAAGTAKRSGLGAKRLPQVGEVWRNRGGALVAVMSAATVLDGGYNVVTLSKSDTARNPGRVYLVDLDGHVYRDHSGAPGDLVSAVTRFDQ